MAERKARFGRRQEFGDMHEVLKLSKRTKRDEELKKGRCEPYTEDEMAALLAAAGAEGNSLELERQEKYNRIRECVICWTNDKTCRWRLVHWRTAKECGHGVCLPCAEAEVDRARTRKLNLLTNEWYFPYSPLRCPVCRQEIDAERPFLQIPGPYDPTVWAE
jgi:hypothetical protein